MSDWNKEDLDLHPLPCWNIEGHFWYIHCQCFVFVCFFILNMKIKSFFFFSFIPRHLQEPDEQEAPDDQDSSPPEDTSLYPHSPGTTQFQQVSNSVPWYLFKFFFNKQIPVKTFLFVYFAISRTVTIFRLGLNTELEINVWILVCCNILY